MPFEVVAIEEVIERRIRVVICLYGELSDTADRMYKPITGEEVMELQHLNYTESEMRNWNYRIGNFGIGNTELELPNWKTSITALVVLRVAYAI